MPETVIKIALDHRFQTSRDYSDGRLLHRGARQRGLSLQINDLDNKARHTHTHTHSAQRRITSFGLTIACGSLLLGPDIGFELLKELPQPLTAQGPIAESAKETRAA